MYSAKAVIVVFLFLLCPRIGFTKSREDSVRSVLKNVPHDTIRCRMLNNWIESEPNDAIWPLYNDLLYQICEVNLKGNQQKATKDVFLKFYANSLNNKAIVYQLESDNENALKFLQKSLLIQEQINDQRGVSVALSNIGSIYIDLGKPEKAIEYNEKSLKIQQEIGDKEGVANSMQNIASIYSNQGNIPKALDYFQKILKVRKEIHDKNGLAQTYTSIANIYNRQKEYQKAEEFYKSSIQLNKEINDTRGLVTGYNNLAFIYLTNHRLEEALELLNKCSGLIATINSRSSLVYLNRNFGWYYKNAGNLPEAIKHYSVCLTTANEIGDKRGCFDALLALGTIYDQENNLSESIKFYKKAYELSLELGFPENIKNVTSALKGIYLAKGDFKNAYEMFELNIKMRDSINNIENRKASLELQYQIDFEKKEIELKEKAEFEKRQLQIKSEEEQKRKNIIIYSVVTGFILVLFFAVFILRSLQQNRRANKIISAQKEEVEVKNHLIEEKQKEILDSIAYAKRLQEAILPPQRIVNSHLPDNFIIYQPKDIVAGDFYWFEHLDNCSYIAAADSTGHGVPGAMVSVVCSNALNRAVHEFALRDPGKILDKTRELVLETFSKSDKDVKDGMDISLAKICEMTPESKVIPSRMVLPKGQSLKDVLDAQRTYKVEWAGANNPLWYFNGQEMIEINGHKQTIGKTDSPTPFITHAFNLKKGNVLYLFTDGFADQFGGPKGKKFKYKQLMELLLSTAIESSQNQKITIEKAFDSWKGNLEQVDDVCLIGIKL